MEPQILLKLVSKEFAINDYKTLIREQIAGKNPKNLLIILNSFYKKLVMNEGVLDSDDINRLANMSTRKKISTMMVENEDVAQALVCLKQNRSLIDNNELAGYFTLLQKLDKIEPAEVRELLKQFKMNLI